MKFLTALVLACSVIVLNAAPVPDTTYSKNLTVYTNLTAKNGAFTNSLTLGGNPVLTNAANWVESGPTNSLLSGTVLADSAHFWQNVDIDGIATVGTLNATTAGFTSFTATHLTVTDITSSNKLVSTSPTSTAFTNGYAAALTNTWGIFTGDTNKYINGAGALSAIYPVAYTTATLPSAAANTGVRVYVSDAITPWTASGGVFVSDGTNWREKESRIIATAVMTNFMQNCIEAQWVGNTPYMQGYFGDTFDGQIMFGSFVSAISSATRTAMSVSGQDYLEFSTSTSSSASAFLTQGNWFPAANDWFVTASNFKVPTASSTTESFYVFFGAGGSTSPGGNHSGFLYDPNGAFTTGISGPATNNWTCYDQASGVLTNFITTGIALDTTSFHRFTHMVNSTNSYFYYDGAYVTNTLASPVVSVIPSILKIAKFGSGTTARTLDIDWNYYALRYGTPRTITY